MASFIGKTISLLSHSDIRYRGTLHSIDAAQATIQLSNVYSMGTETRRPAAEYIPPRPEPYASILFRATEVKDLTVDPQPLPVPPAARNVHDDPAIIGISQGAPAQQAFNYPGQYNANAALPTSPAPVTNGQDTSPASSSQPSRRREANGRSTQPNANSVRSAAASLENVERAMGDLRVGESPRNGRRGHASRADEIQAGNINVPAADFDFASSNAKFDKAALAKPDSDSESDSDSENDEVKTNPSDPEADGREKETKEKDKVKGKETAYNPSKSFFDTLTPNSAGSSRGGGAGGHRGGTGGGRGRGRGRSRREEEAQRNLMTFGETTSPSHASGWGGGRRGGSRRGGYVPQSAVSNGRPG